MNDKKRRLLLGIFFVVIVAFFVTVVILKQNQSNWFSENEIIKKWTQDVVIPSSIQKIELENEVTPEFILENGEMVIFTNQDASGWALEEGNKISWKFEKQSTESGEKQALSVGYIKNKMMYGATVYQKDLDGEYTVNIDSNGVYYIYCMGTSSDPISLKTGDIKIDRPD